jgi:hypothetical protein
VQGFSARGRRRRTKADAQRASRGAPADVADKRMPIADLLRISVCSQQRGVEPASRSADAKDRGNGVDKCV